MRTKQERKHNTWTKILKKLNLIKSKCKDNYITDIEEEFMNQPHRLSKDKLEGRQSNLHTNNKTKRHIYGNYQKTKNYSKRDMQQIDAMNYEEIENEKN